MRVSALGSYLSGLDSMRELQSALDRTQRQISSGRRLLTPSDDPISASRALDFREQLARLDQFDRNSNIAENRLLDEEAALSYFNNTLQRVRELALQANNSTQSNESRALIATEMRQRLGELIDIANSKDGSGRYLFSGNLDATTPVTVSSGGYQYNGDQGGRQIQIGDNRRVPDGDSGDDVFFRIRAGNGTFVTSAAATNTGSAVIGQSSVTDGTLYDSAPYTVRFITPTDYEVVDGAAAVIATGTYQSGESIGFRGIEFSLDGITATGDEFNVAPSPYQDIFASVDALVAAVNTPVGNETTRAEMSNGINAGLKNVDQAIGNILDVRTRIGSRLSAIEGQVESNSAFSASLQGTLGGLEDLDYAEALSRLSFEAATLEAAQKSFVAVQRLSLFNFL